MKRMFSDSRVAVLKSQVNAIGIIIRLLRADSIDKQTAASELQRIQSDLYQKVTHTLGAKL